MAIQGIGAVRAVILADTEDGYRLKLSPTPEQRRSLLEILYTREKSPGAVRGDIGLMLKQIARLLSAR